MKFIDIPESTRKALLDDMQTRLGLKSAIIEKDWWVTAVLRALYGLSYAQHISFKGGTSLSKCWNLIERMSEDIDIGVTREFLGYGGTLSKTQISDKLRRAACTFVREHLQHDLREQMLKDGISGSQFNMRVDITSVSTTDPEVIWVEYRSVAEAVDYILPVVKIEVSGRSMSEPVAYVSVSSMIDTVAPEAKFHEPVFEVRAVLAKRTFLEKIFLLHEEFSKNPENIRIERMSRHLYDIHRMMQTQVAVEALSDNELYNSVIEHRKNFIGLRGFSYSSLNRETLAFIPPSAVLPAWKRDYETMRKEMIYGDSVSFERLLEDIAGLNRRINSCEL